MQFRTGLILAVAVVGALLSPLAASAQQILYEEYLESAPNGSTYFRASATNATTGKVSDSTGWIRTNGWERASLQHSFTDSSAAVDSTAYTIFLRWSNDGVTPFLSDSLPHEPTEGATNLDTLIIRSAQYLMVVVRGGPGNESGGGATTYSRGRLFLVAKGRKQ